MGMAKDQEIFVAPEEVVTPPLPGQALVHRPPRRLILCALRKKCTL